MEIHRSSLIEIEKWYKNLHIYQLGTGNINDYISIKYGLFPLKSFLPPEMSFPSFSSYWKTSQVIPYLNDDLVDAKL